MHHPQEPIAPPAGAFLGAELVAVSVIILTTLYLAAPPLLASLDKTRFSELLVAAPVVRMELAVEHAVSGRWTNAATSELKRMTGDRLAVDQADGSFAVRIESVEGPPDYLALERITGDHATLVWRCGLSQAPFGQVVPAPRPTQIRPELLPAACRYPGRP